MEIAVRGVCHAMESLGTLSRSKLTIKQQLWAFSVVRETLHSSSCITTADMDTYSSQLQLVPKKHSQKSVYPAPHTSRKTRKTREETKDKGVVFVLVLSILSLITVTCIAAFYINHIQEYVRRLEQRTELLEQRPGAKTETGAEKEEEREAINNSRVKRGVLEPEESEHHRMYHHGIASHNIAYVFGDPAKVNSQTNNTNDDRNYRFTPNTKLLEHRNCTTLYVRGDGQKYCTRKREELPDKYMTNYTNLGYDYFEKAEWMFGEKSKATYDLKRDGKITVKKPGIYIIHANVHFLSLGKHVTPSFEVHKTNSTGGNDKLLGKCVVSLVNNKTSDADRAKEVYPCASWQLAHLEAGDIIYMDIASFTWFRVEQETLHLALIKLNNDQLQRK